MQESIGPDSRLLSVTANIRLETPMRAFLIAVSAFICPSLPVSANDSPLQTVEFLCSPAEDAFLIKAKETYEGTPQSIDKEYSPTMIPLELQSAQTTLKVQPSLEQSCRLKKKIIVVKLTYGEPSLSGPDSGTPGAALSLSVNGTETLKDMTFDRPCYACESVSRIAYINGKLEICGTLHDETRCTSLERDNMPLPVTDFLLFWNLFRK